MLKCSVQRVNVTRGCLILEHHITSRDIVSGLWITSCLIHQLKCISVTTRRPWTLSARGASIARYRSTANGCRGISNMCCTCHHHGEIYFLSRQHSIKECSSSPPIESVSS